ncbi:Kelch-like protein 3 [Eumeta japonica]|uniref:Kelch-like protein 3 n=1 Tax=Eumeta variegata TaxID=151549 RepID=A0A4C1UBR9_EUMVA|nr:Kelch-like protein 3 [Eumeta japonica]
MRIQRFDAPPSTITFHRRLTDAVYLTGGRSPSETRRTLLRYEVTAGSVGEWRACADLSCGRIRHAAVVLRDHLYVIGGLNDSGHALKTVSRYDFATDRWEDIAVLNSTRYDCMAGAVGSALLVAGGYNLSNSSVDIFKIDNKCWLTTSPMPDSCYGAGYAAM